MKTVEISEDAIWQLQNLAESPTCYELNNDFQCEDHNQNDCYKLGEEDGRIILAREILHQLGVQYVLMPV